jgi:hypothetical protein
VFADAGADRWWLAKTEALQRKGDKTAPEQRDH